MTVTIECTNCIRLLARVRDLARERLLDRVGWLVNAGGIGAATELRAFEWTREFFPDLLAEAGGWPVRRDGRVEWEPEAATEARLARAATEGP